MLLLEPTVDCVFDKAFVVSNVHILNICKANPSSYK